MKNLLAILILIGLLSSCTYMRKANSTLISGKAMSQGYDGTYVNKIHSHNSFWSMLKNEKKTDTTGCIGIRTLDQKTILVTKINNNQVVDSILVKGKLKGDEFYFKRRLGIEGAFPLFYYLIMEKYSIAYDEKEKPLLSHHSWGIAFFILIAPVMAADGRTGYELKKKNNQ